MTSLIESELLHARVRAFARGDAAPHDTFEALALALARYQRRESPAFARLCERHGSRLDELASVPGVPTEAFRRLRVTVTEPGLDVACFETSGTTSERAGKHAFRTLQTTSELALRAGSAALRRSDDQRCTVLALAPEPGVPGVSSLGHMMRLFIGAWDGRALALRRDAAARSAERLPEGRWLVTERGVDLAALERGAAVATERREPLLLLATSFALVHCLDALGARRLPLPADSVVMQTGGFKGRSRVLSPAELRARAAETFGLDPGQVVGEYGMTELSSQLYEGTRAGASCSGPPGEYLEPPWLRVVPVHPSTLEPVPDGEVGIARIIDLGNVDSAVVVQTEDRVRRGELGVELLGRLPAAPARGCSLAVEDLLG